MTPTSVRLDFVPSRDGFAFVNAFAWTETDLDVLSARYRSVTTAAVGALGVVGGAVGGGLVGALAGGGAAGALGRAGVGSGLLRRAAQQWPGFGLCGGMAALAIERWPLREGQLPTSQLRPDPIRKLLWRRQKETLDASLTLFASFWARVRFVPSNTPHAPFADALRRELDRIGATLAAGRPALVGLVGDAPDPFALHQVVVFGIERQGPVSAVLAVYDPNRPGRTHHITTRPAPQPGRTALTTDMATGPRAGGRVHISTRPGELSHLFQIDLD